MDPRAAGARLRASLEEARAAWLVLLAGMCVSATWLLVAGNGLSLTNDGIFYYLHYIQRGPFVEVSPGGLEYLLAPSNGHFQLGGKLIYRAVFELFGPNYFVLRAIDVAGVMLCVGLFFELARRQVGYAVALVPCLSLLFLGYGWEALLWAFDMHTVYALAFGLAALLAIRRNDRAGDVAACLLLLCSLAMIELGLAFVAGVAVAILATPASALRRGWIVAVPVVLYAIWWVWAGKFEHESIALSNVGLIPRTLADALAAVLGAIAGVLPVDDQPHYVVGITGFASALAVLAAAALVWRLARAHDLHRYPNRGGMRDGWPLPPVFWAALAVLLVYWVLIAIGGRPPDSSRYVFVGALLAFLVAAAALAGRRVAGSAALAATAVVLLAIPANVQKLNQGRDAHRDDAHKSRTELAMVELAGERADPEYVPGEDPRVLEAGGSVFTSRSVGDYLPAAREFGGIGYSLDRVRSEDPTLRAIADATLVGALGIGLRPVPGPADPSSCPTSRDGTPEAPVFFELPAGGARLGVIGRRPVAVSVRRFGEGGGVPLGTLEPGAWGALRIPPDKAPDPWLAVVDGPVYVCDLR